MNYYEEMGLRQTASTEEIRQAYRALVRLLHPDHQQNEELARLAECQMRRLNGIVTVLTDPHSRVMYDLTLNDPAPLVQGLPAPRRWFRAPAGGWLWIGMVAIIATSAYAYFAVSEMPLVTPSPELRQLDLLRTERDAAIAEISRLRTQISADHLRPAPPQLSLRRFAGNWFYVRPVYPPEYIELLIVEEDGMLRGRYRARYQISDRAISPEVAFQFEGKGAAPVSNISWAGADGAKGELRLKLLTEHSMQVDWFATGLGKLGLASGAAVLSRRQP